jgi:hypothetical protein
LVGFDLVRVHHQLPENIRFIEGVKADGYGNADEEDGNAHDIKYKFNTAMLMNLRQDFKDVQIEDRLYRIQKSIPALNILQSISILSPFINLLCSALGEWRNSAGSPILFE